MLASTPAGGEEKRKTPSKTGRFAAQKRTGLSIQSGGEGETKKRAASNANFLAFAQRAQWVKEEDPNGRLLLPKQELRILRDYREDIHALVGYGVHGTNEEIQDFKCQACRKKFTARKNTILYRLKSHSGLIEKILWLLALGVDALALEEVFGVRGITIRTWLCRSGMQGKKLHEHSVAELELVHVQLDELWANVKDGSHDMWVWIVSDVKTKLTRSCRWGDEVRRWRLPWFTN